jgi:hypothetical protein
MLKRMILPLATVPTTTVLTLIDSIVFSICVSIVLTLYMIYFYKFSAMLKWIELLPSLAKILLILFKIPISRKFWRNFSRLKNRSLSDGSRKLLKMNV